MKQNRFPVKTAADTGIKNSPASATDKGDYLSKEMDKDSGLGKHEDKVNTGRAGESETQRDKEHKDVKRLYGPNIRLETAASAKEAVTNLRARLAAEKEELKDATDKAEGLTESVPEEAKEAETLKDVLKDLGQADKDLKAAEKELDKLEPEVAKDAEKEDGKKEASIRYNVRRAAEEMAPKVEGIIEDVHEVIQDAKEDIKDAEKIIKHEEGGEKKEGPHAEAEELAPEKGEMIPASFAHKVLNIFERLAGGKKDASSNYPPGKTQEDKGDYETKEKMSQGQFETKEWAGMAKKDEGLRGKEHKLPYNEIKNRGPLQGISLSAKFTPNALKSKSSWTLYRGETPIYMTTYADVAGANRTAETWNKFAGKTAFASANGQPKSFGDVLVAKASTEGLKAVLADAGGRLLRTAAGDNAGENMNAAYLKKYYTEAYGDASFAAGLVASMSPKVASAVKDTVVALEAKLASAEADKNDTIKAHKCVAVARLQASRGSISFDKQSLEKAASALMSKPVAEIDKMASELKGKAIINQKALVAATIPDKGDNSTPGAEAMAEAESGIAADKLQGVTEPGAAVTVDGKLPAGSDQGAIEEGKSVNPDKRYDNQRKPLESVKSSLKDRLRAQAAARGVQAPSSQVVPQLTKTAAQNQDLTNNGVPDLSEFFYQKTEAGRAQAAGVDLGRVNKNFIKR